MSYRHSCSYSGPCQEPYEQYESVPRLRSSDIFFKQKALICLCIQSSTQEPSIHVLANVINQIYPFVLSESFFIICDNFNLNYYKAETINVQVHLINTMPALTLPFLFHSLYKNPPISVQVFVFWGICWKSIGWMISVYRWRSFYFLYTYEYLQLSSLHRLHCFIFFSYNLVGITHCLANSFYYIRDLIYFIIIIHIHWSMIACFYRWNEMNHI